MGNATSQPVHLPPSHFLPETTPSRVLYPAGHPPSSSAVPPPGCPMHVATPPAPPPPPSSSLSPPPECPMHDPSKLARPKPAAAECPIDHASLSPLNQMPTLSQTPLSASQRSTLPTDREVSSIPRTLSSTDDMTIPATSPTWVYPSAQQFYNALVRKGWETPEEDVESMVFIHNHLNEVAWREVLEWEARRPDGKGKPDGDDAELKRFKGRPGTLSPKARMYLWLGTVWPETYNTEPPFDRHDWVVRRPSTDTEHRYVIDYYSAPPDPDGSPNFHLDVRPALDDLDAVRARFNAFVDEWKGGAAGAQASASA